MVNLHLLTIILVLMSIFSNSVYAQDIKNYLTMKVEIVSDTVCFQDSLIISVQFENKTDKECLFRPRANWTLDDGHEILAFGLRNERYIISRTVYVDYIQCIAPFSDYRITLPLFIDPTFFKRGLNEFVLYYSCRKIKNKKLKCKNEYKDEVLYGSLESQKFFLYIQ